MAFSVSRRVVVDWFDGFLSIAADWLDYLLPAIASTAIIFALKWYYSKRNKTKTIISNVNENSLKKTETNKNHEYINGPLLHDTDLKRINENETNDLINDKDNNQPDVFEPNYNSTDEFESNFLNNTTLRTFKETSKLNEYSNIFMPDTESSTLSSIIDDYDNSLNDIRSNEYTKEVTEFSFNYSALEPEETENEQSLSNMNEDKSYLISDNNDYDSKSFGDTDSYIGKSESSYDMVNLSNVKKKHILTKNLKLDASNISTSESELDNSNYNTTLSSINTDDNMSTDIQYVEDYTDISFCNSSATDNMNNAFIEE